MFSQQDKQLIKGLMLEQLPAERQEAVLEQVHQALQIKVGMAIEDALSDEQLLEFEKLSCNGDDDATARWLKQTIPHYDQIIARETVAVQREMQQNKVQFQAIVKKEAQ